MTTLISKPNLKQNIRAIKEVLFTFPLYIITHPFKGFDEMKYLKRGDLRYVVFFLITLGMVSILEQTHTGFIVTGFFQASPFVNVPFLLIWHTYLPILLFVIANWSITTITDGKGSIKDILLAYCYAHFLTIICTVIGIILSNFMTINEAAFATFFFTFGQAAGLFYLFIGLIVIHEYTFRKAVLMVVLTILAMLIITFVLALFFSLLNNVFTFFLVVYDEIVAHHLT